MRNFRLFITEVLNLSAWSALIIGGWQTASAAITMQHHLASFFQWIHFAIYTLGGFILFALLMLLPVVVVAGFYGFTRKSWSVPVLRRFLMTGMIGTMAVIVVGILELFGSRSLLEIGSFSILILVQAAVLILSAFILGYVISAGVNHIIESKTSGWAWRFSWGWWTLAAILPPVVVKIYKNLSGNLSPIWLLLMAVVSLIFIVIAVVGVPRFYGWLCKRKARPWIAAAVMVILFIVTWPANPKAPEGQPASSEKPPVVLITIDTLRADALTCYPEGTSWRLGTPVMDGIASDGIIFEQAFAPAPWTRPSVPSFLTGLPPSAHGVVRDSESPLTQGATTIAEILSDAGWSTCGVVVNSILHNESGIEQGFDLYFEEMSNQSENRKLLTERLIDRFRLTFPDFTTPNTSVYMDRVAVDRADRFIRDHTGERFFLWVHLFGPHTVYYPPEEYRLEAEREWGITIRPGDVNNQEAMKFGLPAATNELLDSMLSLYAADVTWSDKLVGDVIDTLKDTGIFDECLVIISSDHGEEFYEHGLTNHGRSLYPEVVHVPLIFRWPQGLNSGARIDDPVSLLDLAPTILALVDESESRGMDTVEFTGRSLVPLMNGDRVDPVPVFFESPLHYDQMLKGVLFDGYYYIGGSESVQPPKLFNYEDDPYCYYNIIRDYPDEAEYFFELIVDYENLCAGIADRIGAVISGEDIEALRSLGYIM